MSADDYSRALSRVVVAQIAEVAGFEACQESAVDILGDLLLRYTSQLCSGAHDYAELASRTEINLADVLLSLADLGSSLDELSSYARLQDLEVPFAHAVAPFPVERQPAGAPTFEDKKERPPPSIPTFLPAFPDPHTYQQTASFQGHETNPQKQRQATLQGKQQAEAALVGLHKRLVSATARPKAPEANPFMAAPSVAPASPSDLATEITVPDTVRGRDAGTSSSPAAGLDNAAGEAGLGLGFDAAAAQQAFQRILPAEMRTGGGAEAGSTAVWSTDDVREADGSWIGWRAGADSSGGAGAPASFTFEPGVAERRAALALAAQQLPSDAFEERARTAPVTAGSRQRKSKYDADPKTRRAEEILAAGGEAVYAGDAGMDVDEADADAM